MKTPEISQYGIYEEIGGDIYTEQIDADNDTDAIEEASATFEALSNHDKKRRAAFELVRNLNHVTLECDEVIVKFI